MSTNKPHVILGDGRFIFTEDGELFRIGRSKLERKAIIGWQYCPSIGGGSSNNSYFYKPGRPRLLVNIARRVKEHFDKDLETSEKWAERVREDALLNNQELEDVKKEAHNGTLKVSCEKRQKSTDIRLLGLKTGVPGVSENSTIFNPFPL